MILSEQVEPQVILVLVSKGGSYPVHPLEQKLIILNLTSLLDHFHGLPIVKAYIPFNGPACGARRASTELRRGVFGGHMTDNSGQSDPEFLIPTRSRVTVSHLSFYVRNKTADLSRGHPGS